MKAYCENCKKFQPSSFSVGHDAVTGVAYEDLCCDTCHLILATVHDREAQQPVAWMHEWDDGEKIPLLYPRDNEPYTLDQTKSVRPLVYGDTAPPAQQEPVADQKEFEQWCKHSGHDYCFSLNEIGEYQWADAQGACEAYWARNTLSQPARKPLTDEQIKDEASYCGFIGSVDQLVKFVRRIEATHGIKESK